MTTIIDILGTSGPNPFDAPIQTLVTSTQESSALEATRIEMAAQFIDSVTNAAHPVSVLYQLWDAFFRAAIASESSYVPHLALLDALRAHPPTQPITVAMSTEATQLAQYTKADGQLHWSELPGFGWQWRDVHDVLEAHRDWDSAYASGPKEGAPTNGPALTGGEYYLRFCRFSAALLKDTNGKDQVHPVQVFYTCRNVLECKGPEPREEEAHRLTTKQLWALDIRAVATWLLDGGRALWETDYEYFRKYWADTLDWKSERWPREDGLTGERWRLWEERLRTLSKEDESLDDGTRAMAVEAADVIKSILAEKAN
ncbi:hypothetical protein GQ44DRAFT_714184 [Phaeosphaeriaceae sp. PMI808]|nr:hypothetical protein GQ44DRAFT_714184 [Phaeosphaeriaceae sp. PMI808]